MSVLTKSQANVNLGNVASNIANTPANASVDVINNAAGAIGDAVGYFQHPLSTSAKEIGEGLTSVGSAVSSTGEAFSPQSIIGDTMKTVGGYMTGERGVSDIGSDIESVGKAFGEGVEALTQQGGIAGDIARGATDLAGKVSDVLPSVADTAALGLASKITNSAMGVAQGTLGQAVDKVAVPVIQAADISKK